MKRPTGHMFVMSEVLKAMGLPMKATTASLRHNLTHATPPRAAASSLPLHSSQRDSHRAPLRNRVMAPGADDIHLDVALDPGAPVEVEVSELNTPRQEGERKEADEADAPAAAARPLAAKPSTSLDVARRVVARWRAFVAERNTCPLLDVCQAVPDLFEQEVLKRLNPFACTMLAQVGRPWLAAILASGLPRLPKGRIVRLKLRMFCTSVERLALAREIGCPWGLPDWRGWWWLNPCALTAEGGHLEVLRWARQRGCQWDESTCFAAAMGGQLNMLKWARQHHCPWDELTCTLAAEFGHLEVLRWAWEHGCPWDADACARRAIHQGGDKDMLTLIRHLDGLDGDE